MGLVSFQNTLLRITRPNVRGKLSVVCCVSVCVCVCARVCVWSYHFRGHPGGQIMDGLSNDAHGGENEHNPQDHTRPADRETDKSSQVKPGQVRSHQRQAQGVWARWGDGPPENMETDDDKSSLDAHTCTFNCSGSSGNEVRLFTASA